MIRVLIVEDEPPIQRAMQSLIERLDASFEVSALADDGEQALRMLREGAYDVVFTDIRMPVMSGLELMEAVTEQYPDVMLVVVSGYGTFEYSTHALRARALDYLLKPVSETEMAELLSRLRQRHALNRKQRLARALSAGMNRALAAPGPQPEEGAPQRVLVALFSADAQYWRHVDLEALITDLLGELRVFLWVFMGDTESDRVVLLEVRPGMAELIEYLYEHMRERAEQPVRCVCLKEGTELPALRAAIRALSDEIRRMPPQLGGFSALPVPEPGGHPLMEQVRAYLEQNYHQHITNQTLADRFGYVPSYISRLFHKARGVSPADYLTAVRLEHARRMLTEEPRAMIKEIAERVGFKNQYHFSKAFKKHTGQWPTNYREGK